MQRVLIDLADPEWDHVKGHCLKEAESVDDIAMSMSLDDYFARLIDGDRDEHGGKFPVVVEVDRGIMELLGRLSERYDEPVPDIACDLMVVGLAYSV